MESDNDSWCDNFPTGDKTDAERTIYVTQIIFTELLWESLFKGSTGILYSLPCQRKWKPNKNNSPLSLYLPDSSFFHNHYVRPSRLQSSRENENTSLDIMLVQLAVPEAWMLLLKQD